MRHTAASDILDGRAKITTVQAFLGHSNLTTTAIYLRVANLDEMRGAIGGRGYDGTDPPGAAASVRQRHFKTMARAAVQSIDRQPTRRHRTAFGQSAWHIRRACGLLTNEDTPPVHDVMPWNDSGLGDDD